MSTPSRWSASFTVVLVLSLKHHSQGFLSDDETVVSLTPFDLTYTPAHVVRHVTRDVRLLCAHQTDDQTQLQEVSWIRMLMKTSSGWGLLAEQRDNEDEPQSTYNVSVSGRITKDIKDTFLQITWPVATEETFGTYRCDVIGFQRKTQGTLTEVTSEVAIIENEITVNDMLDIFKRTNKELAKVEASTNKLKENMELFSENFDEKLELQSKKIDSIGKRVNGTTDAGAGGLINPTGLVTGKATSISNISGSEIIKLTSMVKDINELKSFKDLFENLITWPEGQFAFLKPKTGCPVDLAFFGGTEKYFRIHTLSRDEYKNFSRHISSLNPGMTSRDDSENFLTLRFCEASGVFNTKPWPSGSYCVNKVDSASCPRGLSETSVRLDVHHTKVVHDLFDFLLKVEDRLEFCCTHTGSASTPIVMPTQSPFILYRTGGRCQEVAGMDVFPVTMNIDTEDIKHIVQDDADGPDMDIQDGFPTKIHLCHYEKA